MNFSFRDELGRQRAANMVAQLPLNGRRWTLEWREADEKRREQQNRLLWLWNGEIQAFMREHCGEIASAEEWHEVMCRKLRPVQPRTLRLPDGTTGATTDRWRSSKAGVREMAEYLTDLDRYCTTLGLLLTHPDDLYREAMSRRAA